MVSTSPPLGQIPGYTIFFAPETVPVGSPVSFRITSRPRSVPRCNSDLREINPRIGSTDICAPPARNGLIVGTYTIDRTPRTPGLTSFGNFNQVRQNPIIIDRWVFCLINCPGPKELAGRIDRMAFVLFMERDYPLAIEPDCPFCPKNFADVCIATGRAHLVRPRFDILRAIQ